MNIGILGRNGQLAWELQRSAPDTIHVTCIDRNDADFLTLDVDTMCAIIEKHSLAQIINTVAFSAVDNAEKQTDMATQVNAYAVAVIAQACHEKNVRLIHISTDFVFDGLRNKPYGVDDKVNPLSVYGKSKALGEQLLFQYCPQAVCIRTSWLYSAHGHNFVKTILRLLAERDVLQVVVDQKGSPTWAYDLARMVWKVVDKKEVQGMLHWSNHGIASWYDFACAIQLYAKKQGILPNNCEIQPILAKDYSAAAPRPAYSVLDKTSTEEALNLTAQHWSAALDKMLGELKAGECSAVEKN